ncbi:MAG: hypothetical protein BRD52_07325 [Bacteroidetes bacterium SW_4_67_19]|nr:MAG: hypothetical protein BRD52_07325 [Bacteroidetes bacterium SW_4_67_19]
MNAPDSTSYAPAPPDEDAAPNEDAAPDDEAPDQTEAHRRLREAVPDDKPALVMELIERHPEGRLVLPKQGGQGAALAEVNLSTEALGPHLSAEHAADAPWWNDEQGALRLYGADLEGAMLRGAVLRDADLRDANLRGATLGGADLRGALLENADLREADLASARLDEAQLGGARLDMALLENAVLHRVYLRFAHVQYAALDQADLREADLWGVDLEGASLRYTDLREALLHEANVQDVDLTGSDLRDADLRAAVLREADLRETDLRGAKLDGADFQRAVLQGTRLQSLLLTGCTIKHVYLSEARLAGTRLNQRQIGGALGEELDGEYEAASSGYLALEQAFSDFGAPDASRWAYIKKRRMQKLTARQNARRAAGRRDWRTAASNGLSYAQAKLAEWVCNYGESIPRTIASIFAVYVVFVVLYGLTGSVVRAGPGAEVVHFLPLSNFDDLATFGLITMTAPEGPQVSLHPNGTFAHLLTSLHTLITIGLTGLLGYVLGNRIHK